MYKKALLCFLVVLVFIPAAIFSSNAEVSMPTAEELLAYVGFPDTETNKLMAGEIISRDLEASSDNELALVVAMLVRAPVSKVLDIVQSGTIYKLNKDVIAFGNIGDATTDKNEFTGLGFDASEAKEVARLLKVKPGSTFNLSTAEIKRFNAIASRHQSKGAEKDAAVREGINAGYRAVLTARYKAFRQSGLDGIAPYDRGGGKQGSPGKELADKTKKYAIMRDRMPDFYNALLNYPHDSAEDIKNSFIWIKQLTNKRPAFILGHRMLQVRPNEYAVSVFREFYVGHNYNSLQLALVTFPIKEGTFVFYSNRTSTDQVAGFGGGMKRKIGGQMLQKEVIKLFTTYRKALEKGGS
jgi:hypothetical protein